MGRRGEGERRGKKGGRMEVGEKEKGGRGAYVPSGRRR